MFILLFPSRKHFYRKSSLLHQSFSRENIIAIILVLVSFVWLGFFSYRNVEYSNELWWQFGVNSQASSFLRAVVGVFFILLVLGVMKMLSPFSKDIHLPGNEELELAKAIVRDNREPLGNLAFTGDKYLLFDDKKRLFFDVRSLRKELDCYGRSCRQSDRIKELIWDFYEMTRLHQEEPFFMK